MGKVRCVRDFKCEICGIAGMLQILSETYARVRHYKGLKDGKPQFEYHRQSIEYVRKVIGQANSNHVQLLTKNRDLKLNKTSFFSGNVSGRGLVWLGHRPSKPAIPGSNPGGRIKIAIKLL